MKTAKLDEQMKRSIIDKRCAETALIEAKTKLVMLEVEKATKLEETQPEKTPTESIPTVNHEQLNAVLIEANKELMEENAQSFNKLDKVRKHVDELINISKDTLDKYTDCKIEVVKLNRKLCWNRFWFISIAGILSGILLFMILNYVH